MNKYKPTGVYLPEMSQLKEIAAIESGKDKKPKSGGALLREIVQKYIRSWVKKNPENPLTV